MNPRHVVGVLVIVVVVVVEESATTAFPKFSLEESFKYHASTAEEGGKLIDLLCSVDNLDVSGRQIQT